MAVALEQGGAVREEVGMGNTDDLQDDALLHLLEKPGNGAADAEAAALVHIRVEPLDLAGPIDLLLDHRAGGSHLAASPGRSGLGPSQATNRRVGATGLMASITWRRVWGRRQAIRRTGVSVLIHQCKASWRSLISTHEQTEDQSKWHNSKAWRELDTPIQKGSQQSRALLFPPRPIWVCISASPAPAERLIHCLLHPG